MKRRGFLSACVALAATPLAKLADCWPIRRQLRVEAAIWSEYGYLITKSTDNSGRFRTGAFITQEDIVFDPEVSDLVTAGQIKFKFDLPTSPANPQ